MVRVAGLAEGLGDVARYGRFQWSDQSSRIINLLVATAIAVYIVRAMQRQRELSTADPLTGLFNRRFFDDYFTNEIARAGRAIETEPLLVARGTGPARVTVSAGVASWPADGLAVDKLLECTDQRLFAAKAAGRNQVVGPPGGEAPQSVATLTR